MSQVGLPDQYVIHGEVERIVRNHDNINGNEY
jgi:hypothetical protein